jgi:hypothetical protein
VNPLSPWRCTCHHWAGWGDSGSIVMRAQCPGVIAVVRADGRPTCSSCLACNPAASADISFSPLSLELVKEVSA